jgi:hypothetical protein
MDATWSRVGAGRCADAGKVPAATGIGSAGTGGGVVPASELDWAADGVERDGVVGAAELNAAVGWAGLG